MSPTTTAIIIDDEQHARESLLKLLEWYCPSVVVIGQADSLADGLTAIAEHRPDLVYLDIHLEDHTGFDLLEQLQGADFQLIFTTAHADYALRAFRHHAIDYLLKPVDPLQLVEATNKAIRRRSAESSALEAPEQIVVASTEGYRFIDLDKIVRIEGAGNYSTIYLQDGERVMASKNLKSFEKRLPQGRFVKVHQSHIVSLKCVQHWLFEDGGCLRLRNGDDVPISRRRREEVMAALRVR